jgi:hypothetical protein
MQVLKRVGEYALISATNYSDAMEWDVRAYGFSVPCPLDTQCPDGDYRFLLKNGSPLMSDTPKEYGEHQWLWDHAQGDVLIGGLGIGFVNQYLINNAAVTSVTIVEKYQDVIDLVWGDCAKDDTFTLIKADIETWDVPANSHWDVGWFDTLDSHDIYSRRREYGETMKDLYTPYCDEIGVWTEGDLWED